MLCRLGAWFREKIPGSLDRLARTLCSRRALRRERLCFLVGGFFDNACQIDNRGYNLDFQNDGFVVIRSGVELLSTTAEVQRPGQE
jgi:hypothetical protein